MGYMSYCSTARDTRALAAGFYTKSIDEVFTQQKLRQLHESMNPKDLKVRECRDSEKHPNTVPIIFLMDLTGSMKQVPHLLIKEGLPSLMTGLINKGVVDASLLFIGVGDHLSDRCPLQVGQFESGDAELDMWLTRTYIEGNGGSNDGESYSLGWDVACNHVVSDHWEKRKKKGYVFTVADEKVLPNISTSAFKEIYGEFCQKTTIKSQELLDQLQEKYNVFHLNIMHNRQGREALPFWQDLLGQHCITVDNYQDVPNIIIDIVSKGEKNNTVIVNESDSSIPDML